MEFCDANQSINYFYNMKLIYIREQEYSCRWVGLMVLVKREFY